MTEVAQCWDLARPRGAREVTHRVAVGATLGGPAAKIRLPRIVRAGVADLVEAVRTGRRRQSASQTSTGALPTALAAQQAADAGRVREPERPDGE